MLLVPNFALYVEIHVVLVGSGWLVGCFGFNGPLRHYCPPPFRRKADGHCFRLSVVRNACSGFVVGTTCLSVLSVQLLLQF